MRSGSESMPCHSWCVHHPSASRPIFLPAQLTCDLTGNYILFDGGFPASLNDRTIYKNSRLYQAEGMLAEGQFIIADGGYRGDGAYKLTPRPRNEVVTQELREYNRVLRS